MNLARMIILDEEALICDLAETYHIFNYRGLPLYIVAVLSCGLREDSRIKMKISNRCANTDTILFASMVDKLALLLWKDSVDGQHNRNRPKSIVEEILNINDEKEFNVYTSIDEFEDARKRILGG